jgi:hypothetical protein
MNTPFFLIKVNDPNVLGEYFRELFFKQDRTHSTKPTLGCYNTFDLKNNVQPLDDELLDPQYPQDGKYSVYSTLFYSPGHNRSIKVIMKYYWGGDGTLEFHFKDINAECYLLNTDCKKTNVWEWQSYSNPNY